MLENYSYIAQTSTPPPGYEAVSWIASQAKEGSFFVLFMGVVIFWMSKDYLKKAIESYVTVNLEIIKALGMIRESSETMDEFVEYAKPRLDYLYKWARHNNHEMPTQKRDTDNSVNK